MVGVVPLPCLVGPAPSSLHQQMHERRKNNISGRKNSIHRLKKIHPRDTVYQLLDTYSTTSMWLIVLQRCEPCLEYRWWCSLCSSSCDCLCTHPLRYRPSSLRHSNPPYIKSYLRRLRELDTSIAEPLSPRLKPAKPAANSSAKGQDTTSEDSELFDSSQVENIQEGMDNKTRMIKRENWLKGKKQIKGGSKEANGGRVNNIIRGPGSGSQDKDEKKNVNSS